MEIYSLISGDEKSKIKVSTGLAPSESLRENPFHVSLLASGGCQQCLAYRHIILISACVFTWPSLLFSPFLSLIMTNVIDLGPILNPGWFHLEIVNYICTYDFSKYCHIHRFWGVIFWGTPLYRIHIFLNWLSDYVNYMLILTDLEIIKNIIKIKVVHKPSILGPPLLTFWCILMSYSFFF